MKPLSGIQKFFFIAAMASGLVGAICLWNWGKQFDPQRDKIVFNGQDKQAYHEAYARIPAGDPLTKRETIVAVWFTPGWHFHTVWAPENKTQRSGWQSGARNFFSLANSEPMRVQLGFKDDSGKYRFVEFKCQGLHSFNNMTVRSNKGKPEVNVDGKAFTPSIYEAIDQADWYDIAFGEKRLAGRHLPDPAPGSDSPDRNKYAAQLISSVGQWVQIPLEDPLLQKPVLVVAHSGDANSYWSNNVLFSAPWLDYSTSSMSKITSGKGFKVKIAYGDYKLATFVTRSTTLKLLEVSSQGGAIQIKIDGKLYTPGKVETIDDSLKWRWPRTIKDDSSWRFNAHTP